jgi:hypothetical protein
MKVRMIHNDEVREHPDHLAERLIEAEKAVETIEVIEITPTVEQLAALGIEPVSEPPLGGYDVQPGETMDESNKRHGVAPISEQPSAD